MATGMGGTRYLTAREAAQELGVSVATLYAYVSRGLVRSEAIGGKRRYRRYRAEDIRRLKERKEQRRDPGRASAGARPCGGGGGRAALPALWGGGRTEAQGTQGGAAGSCPRHGGRARLGHAGDG